MSLESIVFILVFQVDQRLGLLRARLNPSRHYATELDVTLGLEKIELRIRQWARQLRQQYPDYIALCHELDEAVLEASSSTNPVKSTLNNGVVRSVGSIISESPTVRLPRQSPSVASTGPVDRMDVISLVRRIDQLTTKQLSWPTDELLNKLEKQFIHALVSLMIDTHCTSLHCLLDLCKNMVLFPVRLPIFGTAR